MTTLRNNFIIVSVIAAGVLFYLIALLRIDPDELGPLFALLLFPLAFKDIRVLFVSWFLLAVYYAKSGVDIPPNIAANISHNMFVPIAAVITAIYYVMHKRKLAIGMEEIFLILFILFSTVSALMFATDKYDSVRTIALNFFLPLCLYFMVKNMTIDRSLLKWLALAALFHLIVLLPVAIYEYQNSQSLFLPKFKWSDVGDRGRVSGPLGSPIVFGSLIPMLFLHLYVAFKHGLIPRFALWLGGAISGLLIILTFTRSVWLGAFVAFVYIVYKTGEDGGKKLLRIGGFVAFAALLLAVITLSSQDVQQRLTGEENANFRVVMAQASVDMIVDRPLVGWGVGKFDEIVDRYLFDARGVYIVKDTSHVTLLTLLAEIGIVGTSLLLASIYFALRHKGVRSSDLSAGDKLIVAANIGGLVCITINAFLIDMRFYSIVYGWFFVNLGFINNIYREYELPQYETA